MKKRNLLALIVLMVAAAFMFTSCDVILDMIEDEAANAELINTYVMYKDAIGKAWETVLPEVTMTMECELQRGALYNREQISGSFTMVDRNFGYRLVNAEMTINGREYKAVDLEVMLNESNEIWYKEKGTFRTGGKEDFTDEEFNEKFDEFRAVLDGLFASDNETDCAKKLLTYDRKYTFSDVNVDGVIVSGTMDRKDVDDRVVGSSIKTFKFDVNVTKGEETHNLKYQITDSILSSGEQYKTLDNLYVDGESVNIENKDI